MLFTGREIKLRLGLIYGSLRDREEKEPSLPEHVHELKEHLRIIHNFTSVRMKVRFNKKLNQLIEKGANISETMGRTLADYKIINDIL